MNEELVHVNVVVATFLVSVEKLLVGSHVSRESRVSTLGVDHHIWVAVRV